MFLISLLSHFISIFVFIMPYTPKKLKASPFFIDDLQRPADEGRSLHDCCSKFYTEIMNLKTPFGGDNPLPPISDIKDAMVSVPASNNIQRQFIVDLQSTKQKELLPGLEPPPSTKERSVFVLLFYVFPFQIGRRFIEKDLQVGKIQSLMLS